MTRTRRMSEVCRIHGGAYISTDVKRSAVFANVSMQFKALRRKAGMSQVEVARLAKTSQPEISRFERGAYRNITVGYLVRLLEAVGGTGIMLSVDPVMPVDKMYDAKPRREILDCLIHEGGDQDRSLVRWVTEFGVEPLVVDQFYP